MSIQRTLVEASPKAERRPNMPTKLKRTTVLLRLLPQVLCITNGGAGLKEEKY